MFSEILIIGSSNTDMIIKTDRQPMPGETLIGGTFSTGRWWQRGKPGCSCSRGRFIGKF
jgi:hypothetical protein